MTQSTMFDLGHRPMKPPFRYFGAKAQMASIVAKALPPHEKYAEVCVGSGAVFHAHPALPDEVVLSDVNPWVINTLRAIRDCPDELIERLPVSLDREGWDILRRTVRAGRITGDEARGRSGHDPGMVGRLQLFTMERVFAQNVRPVRGTAQQRKVGREHPIVQ